MEEKDLLGFAAEFEAVSTWRTAMLERWRLDAGSSPLQLLLLWQPTDKTDQYLRRFLLDFGHRVLAAERAQAR